MGRSRRRRKFRLGERLESNRNALSTKSAAFSRGRPGKIAGNAKLRDSATNQIAVNKAPQIQATSYISDTARLSYSRVSRIFLLVSRLSRCSPDLAVSIRQVPRRRPFITVITASSSCPSPAWPARP